MGDVSSCADVLGLAGGENTSSQSELEGLARLDPCRLPKLQRAEYRLALCCVVIYLGDVVLA
jgi:hypothetical protein